MTYSEVVAEAKKHSEELLKNGDYGYGKVNFSQCDTWINGSQINLWSYWQGYQIKNIDDGVDIMLVGQDWGSPKNNPDIIAKIERIQRGEDVLYYPENPSPTDKNLSELFKKTFNIDIKGNNPEKRVFFTNYCLGYRKGNESGGMTKTLMKKDEELFDELVMAIKPKIIICLGKMTYEMVSKTRVKNFVKTLNEGNSLVAKYPLDERIKVFGVPHCGALGSQNIGGIKKMQEIWSFIKIE